jgi:hypothetical protein
MRAQRRTQGQIMRGMTIAGIALALLAPRALAAGEMGLNFEHGDWNVVCDNTRTCRAAGYQSDDNESFASVLLTRKAGPGQPVKGELKIGMENDGIRTQPNFALAMTIDGKGFGNVVINAASNHGDLSDAQVQALLASLTRNSAIAWTIPGKNSTWSLSDKGAAAVLLKMDDYQGRIGTRGALIRKGAQDEDKILPPVPMPVVVAAHVIDAKASDKRLAASASKQLRSELLKTVKAGDCFGTTSGISDEAPLSIARLDDRKLLASTLCWTAAYNEGDAYWVINKAPPWQPVLVTTTGTDYAKGEISSGQKGRGLGDCWSNDTWTWDGSQFVHTKSESMGLCKGAPDGAWVMPTLVTQVRR